MILGELRGSLRFGFDTDETAQPTQPPLFLSTPRDTTEPNNSVQTMSALQRSFP